MKRSAMTRSLTKSDAYVFHYKFKWLTAGSSIQNQVELSEWATCRFMHWKRPPDVVSEIGFHCFLLMYLQLQ